MKKLKLFLIALLLLLSACTNKNRQSVESFQGENIATISKFVENENDLTDQATEAVPEEVSLTSETTATHRPPQTLIAPGVTPEATQKATTTRPPSVTASQSPYPVEKETTSPPAQATSTSTLTPPDATSTSVPSQTSTATAIPLDWAGEWNIWYQVTTGNYVHSIMTLTVSGDKVTGNANIDGTAYTFEGVIYDGNYVSGEWHTSNRSVRFWWDPKDENQFLGCWAERFGFCGNKLNAVQPENCRKTPTY